MTPDWYKDAVFYEVHVRAFFDSNGDGIGDLAGLTQKLPYIRELGATCIWLLPFFDSPLRDDGYDVADYYRIHPDYGTLEDFERCLERAHELGLRVIADLVVNHTSSDHRWFQQARSDPKSPFRDYYVWSDDPSRYPGVRVIFCDTLDSNWTCDEQAGQYYWHRFYSHQPDLNFDNPRVQEEMLRVVDFWMGKGLDGFRVDAVPYLFEREGTNCENLPETHQFCKRLRAHVDRHFPGSLLLAEANQWPNDVLEYFGEGDEFHMCFNFPLMPRLFLALRRQDRRPIVDTIRQLPPIPEGCQWATFLRNHDELTLEMVSPEERAYMYSEYAKEPRMKLNLGIRRRLFPLLENDRRAAKLLHSLLLTLPGSPILYYGDEIGMGDNIHLEDRFGCRTPMQWDDGPNAGFSGADPGRLYLPVIGGPIYGCRRVNVESARSRPDSFLNWLKKAIRVRQSHPAFARGRVELLDHPNPRVISYLCRCGDQAMLAVNNLSPAAQETELDLSEFEGRVPVDAFSRLHMPPLAAKPFHQSLGPYSFAWFELQGISRKDARSQRTESSS